MGSEVQTKTDIEYAAGEAVRVIAQSAAENVKILKDAAGEATKLLATATADAVKVLAAAAYEATKVVNVKGADDHDLLIVLKTKLEAISLAITTGKNETASDIKDLKETNSVKIADHELRITTMEKGRGLTIALLSIGTAILATLAGMLIFHLFQQPLPSLPIR